MEKNTVALESKDLARVVEAFSVVGPRNLSALARNSGVPRDTCRYVRDKLMELGVAFRASVGYPRIGLSCYLVLMDFHKETFPHGYRKYRYYRNAAVIQSTNSG